MFRFVLRKLLQAIPIMFGVALITFGIFHIAGGDPILSLAGKYATPEEIHQLRVQYGLDKSLPMQFVDYLKNVATLDFGRSFQTKQTITSMLSHGVVPSISLTLPAFLVALMISLTLALLSALNHRKLLDRILVVMSVMGMSISVLAYILFGQYFLAFQMDWFPISGYENSFWDRWQYIALPALIWVVLSLGPDVRFYRTVFLEEMKQDYVRTARAKGASIFRVLFRHVLPNAFIPMITRIVIEIPFLFLGSLLLENFFGIPGLGSMMVSAINNADWPVVKAMTFLGAMAFIFFNLLSDVLYAIVDPRVRL